MRSKSNLIQDFSLSKCEFKQDKDLNEYRLKRMYTIPIRLIK